MGEELPKNIQFIAACNPYRQKKGRKSLNAGLKRPVKSGQDRAKEELAFLVHPPPLSMTQLMWDYQQLKKQ